MTANENEITTDEMYSEYRRNLKEKLAESRYEGNNHWKHWTAWEETDSSFLSEEEGDLWAEHLEDAFDGDIWFAMLALHEVLVEQHNEICELKLRINELEKRTTATSSSWSTSTDSSDTVSEVQRKRVEELKEIIEELQEEYDEKPGAPVEDVIEEVSEDSGDEEEEIEDEIEKLRKRGEIYSPNKDTLRVV